jgi:hypothetical protein
MSDDDRRIRELLVEAHGRLDPQPPPFRRLWDAAGVAAPPRRRAALAASVLAAGAAAAVLLLLVARGPAPERTEEIARVADSPGPLGSWRGPLDFLLRTPGAEFLESAPVLGAPGPALPAVSDVPSTEEVRP